MLLVMQNSRLRVSVAPRVGGGIADFALRGGFDNRFHSLFRPTSFDELVHYSQLAAFSMAPWAGRLPDGKFSFGEQDFKLEPDWPDGSAIHGLVKDERFNIAEHLADEVRLVFTTAEGALQQPVGCPYIGAYRVEIGYRLTEESLSIETRFSNLDSEKAMPVQLGFHPFMARTLWEDDDEVELRCDVSGRYPMQDGLASGAPVADELTGELNKGRAVAGLELDDAFVGGLDGAELYWPASDVRMRWGCSDNLNHTVLFTGDPEDSELPGGYFCLEPTTSPPGVIAGPERRSEGVPEPQVLGPGDSIETKIELTIA